MNAKIEKAFSSIPIDEILRIAERIQNALSLDSSLIQFKQKGEFVTQADIQIQHFLLNYFTQSVLAGSYIIKAEEELLSTEIAVGASKKEYQLIIDPLDGTGSFCRGEKSWGTMIGLCDKEGRVIYSWNLLSNGRVFSTTTACNKEVDHWSVQLRSASTLRFDIYDYGDGAIEHFQDAFEQNTKGRIRKEQVQITSSPSAIWAGRGLYEGELQGLLWLPSREGKGKYPDYDLTFIGSLKEQGWKVALGKQGEEVHMVVIAPTEQDLSSLWETGLTMTTISSLSCDRDLRITTRIEK